MKILLVDNQTSFLDKLECLLVKHEVDAVAWTKLSASALLGVDAVILSGGHGISVDTHPIEFAPEMELVRTCPVPLLGICLGCQVIASAYGADFKRLDHKAKGLVGIDIQKTHSLLLNLGHFEAYESHRWVITSVKAPLEVMATSKYGIEVIKHQRKPIFGVQFHPEFMPDATPGRAILSNFLRLAAGK